MAFANVQNQPALPLLPILKYRSNLLRLMAFANVQNQPALPLLPKQTTTFDGVRQRSEPACLAVATEANYYVS
jgi:hypothetical protein